MTSFSILVPYRPGDEHHDRNWEWTYRRWLALMPKIEIVVATDDGGSSTAEFNHPLALNRAALQAKGDIFVVADIDIIPDPGWVERAVYLVDSEAVPWAVCEDYRKIDRHSSERILRQDPADGIPYGLTLEEPPITSSCAPPVVISRKGFEAAGGYDERVSWWGADDGIFRVCADTFWGPMGRVRGSALHLWHPRTEFHHPQQAEQQDLVFSYLAASGNEQAVREVRYG